MVARDELIRFIHQIIGENLLKKTTQKEEMANDVQILGDKNVSKIALGVSLNAEFLTQAVNWGANFVILHHGFDVRTYKSRYPLFSQKRLELIFKNNLTLMGFHYALDAHPEIGNNAIIIQKLGAEIDQPFMEEWGYTAVFKKPQKLGELKKNCRRLFRHNVFSIESGPESVTKIAVVSGGGKPAVVDALEMQEKNVELFITGEAAESVPHTMKELGINFFACGHYATEVFGVRELGRKIEEKFGKKIEIEFIDIPNPI